LSRSGWNREFVDKDRNDAEGAGKELSCNSITAELPLSLSTCESCDVVDRMPSTEDPVDSRSSKFQSLSMAFLAPSRKVLLKREVVRFGKNT
jgi:hypothetical protein